MTEPKYYCKNGLSPLEAFRKGLLSREEYVGFCKGNIIKYVVRCEDKESWKQDLVKAGEYIEELAILFASEECGLSTDTIKMLLEVQRNNG